MQLVSVPDLEIADRVFNGLLIIGSNRTVLRDEIDNAHGLVLIHLRCAQQERDENGSKPA
jgi:hypothetical protein